MNKYIYIFIIFFAFGCKSDIDLAMERGIQYYEWGKIEMAILEFKYIIHSLSLESGRVDYNKIKLLSRAHHNLAISYAKKTWYDDAIKEAEKAFELIPTDDNRKVVNLIKKKQLDSPLKNK